MLDFPTKPLKNMFAKGKRQVMFSKEHYYTGDRHHFTFPTILNSAKNLQ